MLSLRHKQMVAYQNIQQYIEDIRKENSKRIAVLCQGQVQSMKQ